MTSTAGDAALTVSDPGHLTNGAFSLPEALRVEFSQGVVDRPGLQRRGGDHVPPAHRRDDPLRTGSYSRTLTFTLSTTNP